MPLASVVVQVSASTARITDRSWCKGRRPIVEVLLLHFCIQSCFMIGCGTSQAQDMNPSGYCELRPHAARSPLSLLPHLNSPAQPPRVHTCVALRQPKVPTRLPFPDPVSCSGSRSGWLLLGLHITDLLLRSISFTVQPAVAFLDQRCAVAFASAVAGDITDCRHLNVGLIHSPLLTLTLADSGLCLTPRPTPRSPTLCSGSRNDRFVYPCEEHLQSAPRAPTQSSHVATCIAMYLTLCAIGHDLSSVGCWGTTPTEVP